MAATGLLPKEVSEFSDHSYWERFFRLRKQNAAFEWYGDFADFSDILVKYLKPSDKILQVGCGNSVLAEQLYDVGFHNVTSIDIVPQVIENHLTNQKQCFVKRPELRYEVCNVTDLGIYSDKEFTAVVDKGTLDALCSSVESDKQEDVTKMFRNVSRVLQPGGRYLVISLSQKHVLEAWLEYFSVNQPALLRVVQVCSQNGTLDDSSFTESFKLPVFILLATILKPLPNFRPVYEFLSATSTSVSKCSSISDLSLSVSGAQQYFQFCRKLQAGNLDTEVALTLYSATEANAKPSPRFDIRILDQHRAKNGKYGVFIVPQGRELEWLFSTSEGRQQLCKQAEFGRLAIVRLVRGQKYKDLGSLQNELNSVAKDLAPLYDWRPGLKIPFLSVGNDIGTRSIRCEMNSEISGTFIVEDVVVDSEVFRRLVFMNSQTVYQSEAKLHTNTKRRPKQHGAHKKNMARKKLAESDQTLNDAATGVLNLSFLCCEHHRAMLLGLALLCDSIATGNLSTKQQLRMCVVGLGGGSLPMFFNELLSQAIVDCVELDPVIVEVATKWFGFRQSNSVSVHVGDGVQFLRQQAQNATQYDMIFIDAATSESADITCPPESFLSEQCLRDSHDVLSAKRGVAVINLVARSDGKRHFAQQRIANVFPLVLSIKVPDQVNQIMLAVTEDLNLEYLDIITKFVAVLESRFKLENLNRLYSHIERVSSLKEM